MSSAAAGGTWTEKQGTEKSEDGRGHKSMVTKSCTDEFHAYDFVPMILSFCVAVLARATVQSKPANRRPSTPTREL
jgi:hypothetical protein